MGERIRPCIEAVIAFLAPGQVKTKGENEWRTPFVFIADTCMPTNQNEYIFVKRCRE